MKQRQRVLACMSLLFAFLFAACGGRQSVASRSAAAYDEAKRKGTSIGGGLEHGGHAPGDAAATAGGSEIPGMDHSGMQSGEMPGMDHSKMQSGSMPAMDHSTMSAGSTAGMDHSKMQGRGTAAMDHSNMPSGMPGMQHGAAATPAVPPAPLSTTDSARVSPSATLKTDPFDAPAPISVSEAAKAANNVPDGDIRHIVPGQDQENPPTPQPAFRDGGSGQARHAQQATSAAPARPPTDHSAHGSSAAAAAQPKSTEATVYTCPMHPEVTSDKPGTCPKCGMALVKKEN